MSVRSRFADAIDVVVGGVSLVLRAERAVYRPQTATVFVADVHLGKAASFRRLGVPVPAGSTAETLGRLDALLHATGATRLVVLGDLLHARRGVTPSLGEAWAAFRARHPTLASVVLVRGNHDARSGDPPGDWRIETVDEGERLDGLVLLHEPPPEGRTPTGVPALAGHVHPGLRIGGLAGGSVRLPCFHLRPGHTVLPAFGAFTGLHVVQAGPQDQLVAVTPEGLLPWPSRGVPAKGEVRA